MISTTTHSRTIKVTNISPLTKQEIIHKLFEFIGPIEKIKYIVDETMEQEYNECYIRFTSKEDQELSIHLTGVTLVDRELMISSSEYNFEQESCELESKKADALETAKEKDDPANDGKLKNFIKSSGNEENFVIVTNYTHTKNTEADLRKFFVACGTIKSINFFSFHESHDVTLIQFTKDLYARTALQLDKKYLFKRRLRIFSANREQFEAFEKYMESGNGNSAETESRIDEDIRSVNSSRRERVESRGDEPRRRSREEDRDRRRDRSRDRYRDHSRDYYSRRDDTRYESRYDDRRYSRDNSRDRHRERSRDRDYHYQSRADDRDYRRSSREYHDDHRRDRRDK